MRFSVYGKGGIGKSTTSSNLSYTLSAMGFRVLQVGCDPKHDSTMLLTGGVKQRTVLEYIREVPPSERRLEDVAVVGAGGVTCIESGGPEPGIGCAGRGILTTFSALDELGLDKGGFDHIVYDVLGDVVCGGFAVPMRTGNTDAVLIVTSGEFMALYAANNILRGLLNFDPDTPRVAGIVLNERGVEDERARVKMFSDAVGVPVVMAMPRSPEFASAEKAGRTVSEMFPESLPARRYRELAELIADADSGRTSLHRPRPLTDDQLSRLARDEFPGTGGFAGKRADGGRASLGMGSCASRGAVFEAGRVTDLPVVVHGPQNCGYVMSHTQDIHYLQDISSSGTVVPVRRNNVRCTGMRNSTLIFGGRDALEDALDELASSDRKIIAVVTTCVSGMIGDDVDSVARSFEASHPGTRVLVVHADGNLSGESEEGRIQMMEGLISLIDEDVEPSRMAVNLADDTFMWYNRGRNDEWVRSLLDRIGIPLAMKLFEGSTVDGIRNCKANILNILADTAAPNMRLKSGLESKGLVFCTEPLPKGYGETVGWVRHISEAAGKDPVPVLKEIESLYSEAVSRASGPLGGKRMDFLVGASADIDWMVEAVRDAGARIGHVHALKIRPGSDAFRTRFEDLNVVPEQSYRAAADSIASDPPDLLVSDFASAGSSLGCRTMSPPRECLTHLASVNWLERACGMIRSAGTEGWKRWGDDGWM